MSKYTVSDETMDNLRSTVRDIGSITWVANATPDSLIKALIDERGELKERVETQLDEILKLEDKLVTEERDTEVLNIENQALRGYLDEKAREKLIGEINRLNGENIQLRKKLREQKRNVKNNE